MQRGIVVSSPIREGPEGELSLISLQLDDDLLKFWILYWDEIVWPWCLGMDWYAENFAKPDWLTYGIVRQIHVPTSPMGDPVPRFMARVVDRAWAHLDQTEPGRWSIASREGDRAVGTPQRQGEALVLSLFDALPTPGEGVSIEDVMLFKERYKSELIELRDEIDRVAVEILKSPDRDFSESVARREFANALDNVTKAAVKSPFEFKLMDMSISYDIPSALGAVLVSHAFGGDAKVLIGSALAGAKIKLGPSIKLRSNSGPPSPFRYVARVKSELVR